MWIKWLPWRFFIRRFARSAGYVDPFALLAQFNRFAQPSEVLAPTEILRAGIVVQARGLLNSQAIQHNLDWVWPYWIEQQFDPASDSFIPRAFSITHINLTHRNWTAVGIPGFSEMPVIDPRGLVMPFFDSWSLDFWICSGSEALIVPSRMPPGQVEQRFVRDSNMTVLTRSANKAAQLETRAQVVLQSGLPVLWIKVTAKADRDSRLAVSVRPCNVEGVSFIGTVSQRRGGRKLLIDKKEEVCFGDKPDSMLFSCYQTGDVFRAILSGGSGMAEEIRCPTGMATVAALFSLEKGRERRLDVFVPLDSQKKAMFRPEAPVTLPDDGWKKPLDGTSRLHVPDRLMNSLFDIALATMVLHSPRPDQVYAGPFTYKRFWFRDATMIANAMLCVGLTKRARDIIGAFFERQTPTGYFRSQEGEWDSNGQVLWVIERWCKFTGEPLPAAWRPPVRRGARWIIRKIERHRGKDECRGLLPAGFSAEHLGPNDHYYWDNFWSIAGLESAANLLASEKSGAVFRNAATKLAEAVERSLEAAAKRMGGAFLPASPSRRMDSGAVGSLAVSYPLQIYGPDEPRALATADYLVSNCLIGGAFFHDISHSGINPYLTLHIAQVLLRGGDPRYLPLVEAIASLASPTGQWPEGIHPRLRTGCMGDGQHVWAASEWVLMLRNMFVREEPMEGRLILCSGIPEKWLIGEPLSFGPAPTIFGPIDVVITSDAASVRVAWKAAWRTAPAAIEIAFPWAKAVTVGVGESSVQVERRGGELRVDSGE